MITNQKSYRIRGVVIDSNTLLGLEGLRVEAWDKDLLFDDALGIANTYAQGVFEIAFEADRCEGFFEREHAPDLYFKIFLGNDCIGNTENSVLWNRKSGDIPVRILVDLPVSSNKTAKDYSVKGTVRLADGYPAGGVRVSAFDRDLRSEQTLGLSTTNKQGFYQIQYSARQFSKAEKRTADLVVKAFAADGSLLAASPVSFNAPPVAEVDLTIPADVVLPPTLFERIGQALDLLLEGLNVEELEEDNAHQDLTFLSGETAFEKPALARFVLAHRLALQGIRAEFWFVLLGSSFYQFTENKSLKEQLALVMDDLPSLNATAIRKAFIRGFNQKEISGAFRENVADWIEAFLKFVAGRSVSEDVKPAFVKLALVDAHITDVKKQETFALLFNEHKALTPELLDALAKDTSFTQTEIADLRTSFELGDLTSGDFSVVRVIKKAFNVRQPDQIRSLAKRSEDEWVKLVQDKLATGGMTLPFAINPIGDQMNLPEADVYGKTLERRFRDAFPTTAFASGLDRAIKKGGAHGLRHPEVLSRFLDIHPDFELLNTPVDDFLKNGILHSEFRTLVQDDSFRLEIKAVQRVFKLAPSFAATDALLADGLHSAQKIYRLGRSEFVSRYENQPGFTTETARLAWNRAADTHAAVLTVVADLKAQESEALPLALKNNTEALSNFPNWNTLFKTGDLCECEHCRSVLSPAAYFAELLMFLKDRKANNPATTVKDILFKRRSDLGFLELNCDNALVPLPYIDVVCEVLENAVDAGGENGLELAGFTAIPVDAVIAKAEVAKAIKDAFIDPVNTGKEKIDLGADFSLSQVNPTDPDLWVVHGDDVTYLLKKKAPSPDFIAEILRNTKASAAELRANPQYVNPKAYDKLKMAKHPLGLPFDLFAEEVRAAFQKTNLQRWDLMRTLRGTAVPNNPADGEIAAEYFGISADPAAAFDEKRLILLADPTDAGQQTVWGEEGNAAWLDTVDAAGKAVEHSLCNVKNFLLKTGLEYNELLALLDLKFINPADDITLLHLDPSCDTGQKVIEVLDAPALDRIHRFLRLLRKLKNWKLWELDLVIRHSRIGNGALDEPFLINLFYFSQLRNRLGGKTSVEQVCALFGDLNTVTRFTKLHEKREDALYQSLFLNKRLANPLDPAFQLDPGTGDLPAGEDLSDPEHLPVIIAALGIREADLVILKELTKASDSTRYITNGLTLANLSFLWRHAWLSRLLKFKVEEWQSILKIFQQDILSFAGPKAAWEFVQKIDSLKTSGFTPDELNWLLAADRSAKSAVKEAEAARFLAALRKELQSIQSENDSAQYDFLTVTPPGDVDRLTALLMSLLQKLNRDEAATQFFIATLRDEISQENTIAVMPAGFSFPASITGAPHHIPIRYEPVLRFSGSMTAAQRTILLTDPSLAAVTGLPTYQQAIQNLFKQSGQHVVVTGLPTSFDFPATITGEPNNIPIHYEPVLRFDKVMTAVQRTTLLADPSLATVTGIAAYQEAIEDFFTAPRLALKFFEPVFIAPLAHLPEAVDFKALPDSATALKISYDAEQRLLRLAGILSKDEKAALDALSSDVAYRNAVNSLFTLPVFGVFPPEKMWLLDADLQFPLRDLNVPANDHLADNLAKASAKVLAYLSKTQSENAVVQQSSTQLGLSEALTRHLLTHYALLPGTLMTHLTGAFVATTGVVEYATLKATFDGWFWTSRVAVILNKWKITLADLEKITTLAAAAQLLDFVNLPLDASGAMASIERFLRTSRLLRLRDSLPETGITLFEVLEKLNKEILAPGTYDINGFATDVHLLHENWLAANVGVLTASLNLTYPADYLLAETWERLRRAFYFLDNLNAGADSVKNFAAVAMADTHAKTIKALLRAKFGPETWLTLSAEIQDDLRQRKRDALAAYILTLPMPVDAPSGKWENTNDLYAYYLLDVEMSSCQLTSRLVQGSGSVQLFVQRCFMGLEPDVAVQAGGDTGDSAWRWWTWMRKYRVWEANRKVFLWPENWIEPELKKDRSSFFKDLENELLQNEINQDTVEKAFTTYLEKINGVAQLEIAGFYQEDDGDNAIIHVFGRTPGAEPHLYYYRRYDYRQWTPWEKVDLDIQGDYLIPAVVNKRLFLFWPVFTEVPDESGNSENVPIPATNATSAEVKKAKKILKLQLAISDNRQGKWTPKRISNDFRISSPYQADIIHKHYRFILVDRTGIDGRFGIKYEGYSMGSDGQNYAFLFGSFEVSGCKGIPENTRLPGFFRPAIQPERAATGDKTEFLKWVELDTHDRLPYPQNDFSLEAIFSNQHLTQILVHTPGIFRMTPPWHLSYMDKLWLDGLVGLGRDNNDSFYVPTGTWLPFFFNDKKRSFFVLPLLELEGRSDQMPDVGGSVRYYYPDIKKLFRQMEDYIEGLVQTWLDGIDLSTLTPAQRQQLEQVLHQQFLEDTSPPGNTPPSYTDEQVKNLLKRYYMRFFHFYLGGLSLRLFQIQQFHFKNCYHPFVCDFAKLVYNPLKGIPALMSRETQLKDSGFSFEQVYQPANAVVKLPPQYPALPDCFPREVVDFTPDGAYASYNWELFFHAPLLIANSLAKNQRFEEARDWYHFIFNPIGVESATTGGSPMSKYWITKPFYETTGPEYVKQRIDNILRMLAGDTSLPGFSSQAKKDLEDQVSDWRTNPFEPHRIANYRTVAYQKTVVIKYLDNLIAWGDTLFRQDSMESTNEAAQMYILAAEILGPRPKNIPPQAKPATESFNELETQFDTFSNALVQVENLVPVLAGNEQDGTDQAPLPMLYFCIPQNDKMMGYWDTVADRLYKLRHCMNIEGVVRQLALFEPPIDPGALVKAVAGGVDISSAIADLNAPLPLYRFTVLLQKANEVCNDVKALGSALLSALEKKDTEAMGLLRQSQEIRLVEAVKGVREQQLEEAKQNLAGVIKNKELITIRRNYYRDIERIIAGEQLSLDRVETSQKHQSNAQNINIAASMLGYLPNITLGASGFGGSPHTTVQWGTGNIISALQAASGSETLLANIASHQASRASTLAGFDRRFSEWELQESLANKELEQIDKSIAAAELRIAIAEKELDNHRLQTDNAKATDAFMRSKYTNHELFQWQIGQVSGVYFQSYKLAYDLSKRAERCFRFELGVDTRYINFGYWDSLKKGLLSGEKLQYDLRRLENAYLEQNRREYELTKHISLVLFDPLALVKLRETGRCFINLPEEILDLDFPGHYFRRIKSVSITLPCVVGPYTTISCTLRLLNNSIRINTANGDSGYPRNTDDAGLPADDDRFIENNIPVKAIAACNAQNDSGVFELSFRDERYLPFEGAGAISQWSLELFNDLPSNNPDPGNPDFGKPLRQFDYGTVTDAILHIKFTAREDAGPFKNGAITHLRDYLSQDGATPSLRLFNLRQEFPTQWHRFLNPANPAIGNLFELEMSHSLFRILDADKTLKVNTIWLLARCRNAGNYSVELMLILQPPAQPPPDSETFTLAKMNQYGGLHVSQMDVGALPQPVQIVPTAPPVKWQLKMTGPGSGGGNLQADEVEDMLIVLGYEWE